MEIIKAIILILIVGGGVILLIRELIREHQRRELAERNMSFIESINLTGLPIITFSNNGVKVNMVLDTGSNVCIINQSILKSLQYEIAETHTGVIGVQGSSEGGSTIVLPLSYKDTQFNFECSVIDMDETVKAMKQEYGVTIHGLLGTGFFQKYKYILDFNSMVAYSLKKD